jgi:hypothetical protein
VNGIGCEAIVSPLGRAAEEEPHHDRRLTRGEVVLDRRLQPAHDHQADRERRDNMQHVVTFHRAQP